MQRVAASVISKKGLAHGSDVYIDKEENWRKKYQAMTGCVGNNCPTCFSWTAIVFYSCIRLPVNYGVPLFAICKLAIVNALHY